MSGRTNKSPDWYPELDIDKIHMLEACREGRIDKVCEFLDGTSNGSAVDIDEGDDDATTALQIAAAKGNLNLVDTLVRNYNAQVNLANELGFTPFLHACREGHVEVAVRLKEYGADETRKTKFGVSALSLASSGGHSEVINFLLSLNLNINSKETNLTPTPLMAAAARSQVQAANCLESRGAKINYESPIFGLSAMHMALISGSADMIDTLIEMGARLEDTYLCNKDAYAIASIAQNLDAVRYIERRRNEKAGAQPLIYPRTLIVDIVDRCDETELRQLQFRSLHDKIVNGITPTMYAVLLGRPQAIQFLYEEENPYRQRNIASELNVQEPEMKMTALMMAIVVGDLDMVEQLLNAGANPHLEARTRKDEETFTAFDLALYSQFSDALKLLFLHEYATEPTSQQQQKNQQSKEKDTAKSVPKDLLNKFLHRFGLSETDPTDPQNQQTQLNPKNQRETFDSLVKSSFLDWSQPLPFVTADQLLMMSKKPAQIQHQATAEDRLQLVKNLAKTLIEKQGLLKPFPVGVPFNGDFTKLESSLSNTNKQRHDDYLNCAPSVEQNYQEMKEANSGVRSRSNSYALKMREMASSILPEYYGGGEVLGVNGVEYDQSRLVPHLQLSGGYRAVPHRRQSENAHTRLNTRPTTEKFWNSSETSAYSRATTMGMESSMDKPYYQYGRTQSPLLTPNISGNLRPSSRPHSVYNPNVAQSMPSSPAIHPANQHRYPTSIARQTPPTQSPKNSNQNLNIIRKRVPHGGMMKVPAYGDFLAGMSQKFDSQHCSSSAPSTIPNLNTLNSMSKSQPNTQRLSILTMNEIENRLKRLQLGSYFSHFVQQEIDPTVFLQLSHSDIQTIVQNEKVADKIAQLIQQLKLEYGGGAMEKL